MGNLQKNHLSQLFRGVNALPARPNSNIDSKKNSINLWGKEGQGKRIFTQKPTNTKHLCTIYDNKFIMCVLYQARFLSFGENKKK